MGNWNINIQGVGPHHNDATDTPRDAEKLAAEFVQCLRDAGQTVQIATITYGSMDDLGGDDSKRLVILETWNRDKDKRSPA